MAFSYVFHRRNENTRTCWSYTFDQTPEHPTPNDLNPLKFTFDSLADEALSRLNALSKPAGERQDEKPPDSISIKAANPLSKDSQLQSESFSTPTSDETLSADPPQKTPPKKRDLYILLRDHADSDPVLSKLWTEVTTVPEWVDWEQIQRGQDVFYRYGGPCLTGLAFQSLLGGLGATRVVETLTRTGGFAGPVIRHRLLETTQHVLQVTAGVSSVQPPANPSSPTPSKPSPPASGPSANAGFASTVRVRLLHAAIRSRILALNKTNPGYYSTSKWGIPINDLDSLATILTFSTTVLYVSLPRQGIFPTAAEQADYTALWRYVAYVIGAPTEPLKTAASAKRWMEALLQYEIKPSRTSQILANNIIAGLAHQPPGYAGPEFLCASARWLNGDELCDALALPNPPVWYKMLVAGQCLFFMVVCYGYRSVASWDRWKIEKLRQVFWTIIVERKGVGLGGESMFEFKYVPQMGKKTAVEKEGGWKMEGPKVLAAERRSARTLSIAMAVVVGFGYLVWKVARS